MPIRKDSDDKRWVEMEVMVPGTPAQVWEAIATGAGNSAWFTETTVEPRVGGALRFDFGGGMVSSGEVTDWQPPKRFAYVERGWAEGAPQLATEITVTARSGDRCVIRMVHSLFSSSDDWDDQLEDFESGWPGYFAVLRAYMAHFAGMRGASFMVMSPAATDSLGAWLALGDAAGLRGASVGERHAAKGAPEPLAGVVEHVYQDATKRYLVLRLDAPSPGIALLGTCEKEGKASLSMSCFFYGEDAPARAAESRPRWQAWLSGMGGAKAGTPP